MTEAEWLVCHEPGPMLECLGDILKQAFREEHWLPRLVRWIRLPGRDVEPVARRRKLLLFAGACCLRSTQTMDVENFWDRELRALVAIAKGRIAVEPSSDRWTHINVSWAIYRADGALRHMDLAPMVGSSDSPSTKELVAIWTKERMLQCYFLRDIFGNPFRPVTFDPAWRTATVTSLAQAIYAERRFTDLPILADALEDAGCTSADVLSHCRTPGEHVRGCWVVDLALGKE